MRYFEQKEEILNFLEKYCENREVGIRKGDYFQRNIFFSREILEELFEKKSIFSVHNSIEYYPSFDFENPNFFDFIIDVDLSLPLSIMFTKKLVDFFQEREIFPIIKYSGNKGFHIILPKIPVDERYPDFYRFVINSITKKVGYELAKELLEKIENEFHLLKSFLEYFNINIKNRSFRNPKELIEKNKDKFIFNADAIVISRRHLIRSPFSINEKSKNNFSGYLISAFTSYELLDELEEKVYKEIYIRKRIMEEYNMNKINIKENIKIFEEQLELYDIDIVRKFFSKYYDKYLVHKKIEEEKNRKKNGKKSIFIKRNKLTIPKSLKKILDIGVKDGRKRSIFILATFFSNNDGKEIIPYEEFERMIIEWNQKNEPPLKEKELNTILKYIRKYWGKYKTPKKDREEWWSIELKNGEKLSVSLK